MPRKETRIGAWLKSLLARCVKSLRRDDSLFWQAKGQLDRELDVKHFIRQSRMVRNALMILTTKRERRLIKMQSRLNVLVHKDERTEDDSSEFLSEEHEGYIKKLIDREQAKTLRLTDRERQLIVGINNYSLQTLRRLLKAGIQARLEAKKEEAENQSSQLDQLVDTALTSHILLKVGLEE